MLHHSYPFYDLENQQTHGTSFESPILVLSPMSSDQASFKWLYRAHDQIPAVQNEGSEMGE
jgi:hypothetical protein